MKKRFNHTKRPFDEDILFKEEEYYAEEEEYPEEAEGEYYAEGEEYSEEAEYPEEAEGEYYAEEEEYPEEAEGEYYAEEEEYPEEAEGEYYAEEEYPEEAEGEYYAEGEEYPEEAEEEYYAEEEEYPEEAEGEYYAEGEEYLEEAEGEYYAEEEEYPEEAEEEYYAEEEESEILYEDEDLYNADYRGEGYGSGRNRDQKEKEEGGFLGKLRQMTLMDRVIAGTGVAVLILGLVTGVVLLSARMAQSQVSGFVSVGAQLQDIDLIGREGLLAVADAQIARLEAASMVQTTPEPPEDDPDYSENDYSRQVTVELNMSSIQKDLKIKFISQKTGKLVANVPFSVTITDPDGKTSIWSDDDMDGIIYKKDIAPGTYKVTVKALSDEKYAGYSVPTGTESVKVRKDIAYQKVDVDNEIKNEKDIDAKKEDTAQKDTTVESALQDTVPWVESTSVGVTWQVIDKGSVTDPLTILKVAGILDKDFLRMAIVKQNESAVTITPDQATGTSIAVGGKTQLTATDPTQSNVAGDAGENITGFEITSRSWSSDKTEVATVDNGMVTGAAAGTARITYTVTAKVTYTVPAPTPTPTPTPTPEPTPTPTPEPTPTPTPEPTTPPDISGGDAQGSAQAAAAVPAAQSQTQPTVETKTETIEFSAAVDITVTGTALAKGTLTADKSTLVTVIDKTATAQVTAKDFTKDKELVYKASSDKSAVATAAVDTAGKVTVTGVAAGTAKITITANYKEGGTDATKAETVITVTVGAKKTIELSSTATLAYVANPLNLTVTVKGAVATTPKVTVESSDTNVMTATVGTLTAANNVATAPITLTLLKEGSATLTVKCAENGEEVKATCTVTVKRNPKEDKLTPLKDKSGNVLYVLENGNYRQAMYADYYTYDKFYIKGEVKYTGWQTLNGHVYYYTAEGKAVTGEQVIQGAKYTFASDGTLVTGNGTLGIDVSKWNGTIDWNAVKNSGVSYVIIRCGYRGSSVGSLVEDPKFQANIKGATAAGLKVGVYFFTQAIDEREAVEEASMVLSLVKNYRISYPIFLDVEASGGRADAISKETRTAVCKAFCATVQNAGYTAGIYANKNWLENKIDPSALGAYKIWLAQYAAAPTYTGRYDLWQYKSTGRVSGISGNVDLNLSYMGY